MTVDLLLPLFSEDYESGIDPFDPDEPASAEISFTFDDEAPTTGGFDTGDTAGSDFAGAVSGYSIVIRDTDDTSGNTIATLSASGGGVADLFTGNNALSALGLTDFILFTADPAEADVATGAFSTIDFVSLVAVFPTDTFATTSLDIVTQASFDQALLLPNPSLEGEDVPALSLDLSRTVLTPVNGSLEIDFDTALFGNDNPVAVPLPPGAALLVAGLCGLIVIRRREA
ncbi:MAG: VPLPA-CTERM sorting domain-containing protein [Pseudomonadota bacterium]